MPYESGQTLWFEVETSNPDLFSANPALDASGTLRFSMALNANGTVDATAILFDDGGTVYGGIDASTPYNFIISATPVNDPPSFIRGATVALVNDSVQPEEIENWATAISAGPPDEAGQLLSFVVTPDRPELFSASPTIDATGTLRFTPAAGAHGVVNTTVFADDNGGWEYGGNPISDVTEYNTILFETFLWGDMNDNGTVGSVDASLVLQYDVGTISYFPEFPPSEYPEYYQQYYVEYFPVPSEKDPFFTPSGDVNWDQTIATVDASLILQQYALLIDYFPADTNQDNYGPDYTPDGKLARRERTGYVVDRELSASVIAGPDGKSWIIRFAVDNANGLCGMKLGLRFDPIQLAIVEEDACLLVNNELSLIATNADNDGLFILAGALGASIDGSKSVTHPTELLSVRFKWVGGNEPSESIMIEIDEGLTRLNDGGVPLSVNSVKMVDLMSDTSIPSWMVY